MTRVRVGVLAAGLLLGGCGDATGPALGELQRAEALWTRTRPASGSYRVRQSVSCFCLDAGRKYALVVVRDTIASMTYLDNGQEAPVAIRERARTVTQLFALVRTSLAQTGVLLHVEYDPVRGFPTTVSLDPLPNAIDDEYAVTTDSYAAYP